MADAIRRASQRLLSVCSFGQAAVPYDVALQLQEGLVALRRTGDVPDTVLRLQVRTKGASMARPLPAPEPRAGVG